MWRRFITVFFLAILFLAPASEIGAIAIVDQRENAAADRNPRFADMTSLLPGVAESPDLRGLLNMESFSGLVVLQRRALQIEPELSRPDTGCVRSRPPPDPLSQAFRVRLKRQQTFGAGDLSELRRIPLCRYCCSSS